MYHTTADKTYLDTHFKQCRKQGHRVSDWGGMQYCNICGSASYILWKRDNKQTKQQKEGV